MDTQQKLTRWRLILGAQTDSEFQKLDPDFKLDRRSLALDAALDKNCERHAWASHYLCDMGKAVIDDLCLREF